MDELKITSKLMRGIVSKLLSTAIKKKTGYKVNVRLNELNVTIADEKAYVHIDADAEMNTNELKKVTKIIGVSEEEL